MKIVVISDTHNQHERLRLPPCELLIHAGDMCGRGSLNEMTSFLKWYSEQDAKHKIFIAGNHDWCLATDKEAVIAETSGITYLEDSAATIEGWNIWGSPWQPEFCDWAFGLPRGKELASKWELIPDKTDILITHGPPAGILDRTLEGVSCGCEDLLKRVASLKPHLHIFGHIHEARGRMRVDKTTFINASSVDRYYVMREKPYMEVVL